ncbi:MAG: LamG-like jellyroll fold domain-containing protein, partial [Patescibacteria group bacterium]
MKTERKKQIKLENFFKGVRKTTRRNSFLSFLKKLRKMKFKEGHPRKKVVFKIRKVRKSALLISLFSQRTYKKGLVSAVVFIIVISLVLQGTNSTLGATYTFSQTDWSGGLDGGIYPTHTSNQSNWSKYDSKSANSSVSGGGADLSLAGTSSSITHTSDTDFSSGTNSQTQVSGTGSGAVIELNRETVVSSLGLSSGGPDNCVVSQYGEVYCWGYNASGNLGDGTTTERLTPVKVLKGAAASGDNDGTYLTNIKSVSTGYHTCAVSNSGNVYCWGNNNYGQAGDETGHPAYTPNRIPKGAAASGDNDGTYLTNVSDVSIGGNSTCATTNSGNAYCWGNGDYGQLGRNSTTSSSTPVRVLKGAAASGDNDGTYLTNVKSINMYGIYGDVNACAVTNADNLYCWGSNLSGQLGDNTTTQRLIPVRVLKGAAASGDNDGTNLTNISSVSLGETHACAASKSGNAYCWGKNANGQLGNDSTTLSNIPVRVLKGAAASGDNDGTYLTNVKSISASGYNNTYAVSNAGNPYSWGEAGYSGKLGDGTTVEKRVPARPVKGEASSSDNDGTYLTNIGDIKGGNYFGCALSASGSAYCWGDNTYGNLGDNTKTYRVSPIRVHGVSDSGNLSLLTVRYTSGNFTSIVDLGQESALTSIIFSRSAPANTTATIDARAGNIATPDGTWTSWQTDISSGGSISGLSGNRFFQYRVNLATTDTSVTPNLDSIDINYQYYGTFSTSEVSFTSSSDYTQEDAVNGTNFSSGVVKMAGSPTDSYDKLALHFDGDASASGHSAASAAGNTQLSSSISKWNGSAYFNGTSALSIPDSDDWNFGTGDFTVDLWFNPTTSGTVRHLTGQSLSGAGTDINFNLWIGADNKINGRVFQGSTAYTVVGTTATSTNTWYHVAFVRSGSNLNLYVNGVAEGGTVSVVGVTPNSSTSVLGIGRLGSYTSNYFSGYIDEFRVSKGVARWTTNFTVPSTYYSSQDSSTKLLLHLDADSSSSQNTLTMYGSSQINSATSKWNGSTYFDGAGDYWTVADSEDWNFGSGDFSIDFWMNSSVKPASNNVWFLGQGSGITNNWSTFFYQTPSGTVGFTVCTGANCYNSSPLSQDITDGQWHHLAGVRNGNTALFFVDGTQVSSLDVTGYTLNNSTSPFSIGYMDSSRFFNGYIDEVRVAKGIARYTSNFTPGQIPFGGYSTSQAYYVSTT